MMMQMRFTVQFVVSVSILEESGHQKRLMIMMLPGSESLGIFLSDKKGAALMMDACSITWSWTTGIQRMRRL